MNARVTTVAVAVTSLAVGYVFVAQRTGHALERTGTNLEDGAPRPVPELRITPRVKSSLVAIVITGEPSRL